MIDNLMAFSIRNKLIIGILTFGLIGWGIYSLSELPIDAVPDITNNQVQVITTAPTLAAQEVERYITYPVEISLATIPDMVEIRSISRFGLSVVTVVFKDHVPILDARQLVGERLRTAQTMIPPGYGVPELAPITTGLSEIYQYVLQPKKGYEHKYSAMELRTIQDWIVKRQILGTPGVADVSSFGGFLKQYEVAVNPDKLKAMGTTIAEVFDALQKNNQNTGGAYIDKKPQSYFIRSIGLVSDTNEIKKIVIKNINGIPLLIKDVAEVKLGSAIRYGAMTQDDHGEVVGGLVLMLKGENSNQVIQNVKERIASIEKSLPEGLTIDPFIDRSKLVDRAIHTVSKNLIEGGLIVVFVLVLLLGNLRAGLIVASVIPLAMLFAISMMNIFGVSGNLMSLGAIDFGLIVDGAVIIVEAIVHHVTGENRFPGIPRLTQEQMNQEVHDAAVKIRSSASFGEIIILMVYLPILALTGVEGKMFKPMAQTVGFAILGAFILSLTYVPMMSSLFLSKSTVHIRSISDRIMDSLHKIYQPLIRKALENRAIIIIISVIVLTISIFVFTTLGGEFLPTLEEGDFAVETRIMSGSSLTQTVETSVEAAKILQKNFPEVKEVIGKIGTSEIPTDPMPIESCDLIIVLKDKDEWTTAATMEGLADKMNEALAVLPGVEFSFQQPIQMRFNELMTGVRQDIAIKIFGENLDELARKAREVSELIKNKKGVGDLFIERVTGLPQIVVKLKRDKIAQYGVSVNDLNTIVRTAFAGEAAGVVFEGERRFDLVVRLNENFRQNIQDVKALYVPLPNGTEIPITELADIEFNKGPMQISREDTKRRITLGINVRDRDVESLVKEIKQTLDQRLKLKPGYYITYGGQFENLIEAKNRLSIAVPVALAIIFLMLFITFGSVKQSLLIFTAIPFAAIGGIFALVIRGMPFSISAGVGFIALFGVAVLNGIVLIAYFNQLKHEGMTDIKERIFKGTHVRLRPVIMTATVASLGFLPMALSGSAGAEVQKPLATVVIGGLISSTILTLFVLPILYTYFESDNKNSFKAPPVVILIIGLIMLPFVSNGQQESKTVTLEEAINIAVQNNPSVHTANYQLEQQKALKKSSFDLNKTSVGFMYGQYNSIVNDNNFSIDQAFANPGVYINNANLARQHIKSSEYNLAASENELIKNVRLVFYQYLISKERLKLFQFQDSLYKNFAKNAELRFKTGESNYLEKVAAEGRMLEVANALLQTEADIKIWENQLQKLLNIEEPIVIKADSIFYISPITPDTARLESNPFLNFSKQQVKVNQAQTKVFKSQLFPDFNIGFATQTLVGYYTINNTDRYFGKGYRFQYIYGGIALPLWSRPFRSRIQASQIGEQIALSHYKNQKLLMETEYQKLIQEKEKFSATLNYYNTKGLAQANTLVKYAERGYQTGESGYLEYIQNQTQAMQIKLNYLETINQINQININLDFILGGK